MIIDFILSNGSAIALFLRLFSLLISLIFIIPLMAKQARVKNGLKFFRYLLLAYGILINASNIITSVLLYDVISRGAIQKELNVALQIINATVFLCASLVGYAMYHYQFTDKNIKAHAKFEKIILQEEKKKKKLTKAKK